MMISELSYDSGTDRLRAVVRTVGASSMCWGLRPPKCRFAPTSTVKHTGEESEGELCEMFQILMMMMMMKLPILPCAEKLELEIYGGKDLPKIYVLSLE